MAVKLFCGMLNGFQMTESAKLCTTKQHRKQEVPPSPNLTYTGQIYYKAFVLEETAL